MRIAFLCRCMIGFSFLALLAPACCDEEIPDLPFNQWLLEADHRELDAHLYVDKPKLTYQQRSFVEVRIEVDAKKLQSHSVHHDLHFIFRLTDAQGNWIDGHSYSHTEFVKSLDKHLIVQWIAQVYLKPGTYVVRALVFDAVGKHRSNFHKSIVVAPPSHDPLPSLAEGFQTAEFFVSEQSDEVPLAQDHANLSIDVERPVRVDVVINFTPSAELAGAGRAYRRTASVMLQLASVLSDLQPTEGCLFVNGVDVQGQQVLLDKVPGTALNRDLMTEKVMHVDPHRVSVHSLETRKSQSKFFNDFLTHVVDERVQCGDAKPQRHVLIVAAGGMLYPEGTQIERLNERACACRIYYLHPNVVWDELVKTLAPLHPRRFTFDDPKKLRKVLAKLKRDIEEYAR